MLQIGFCGTFDLRILCANTCPLKWEMAFGPQTVLSEVLASNPNSAGLNTFDALFFGKNDFGSYFEAIKPLS